eukprot:117440-Heterocapsa_arctica.AAC.1
MASITFTAGCPWQRINLAKGGAKHKERVRLLRQDMCQLLGHLRELADHVRAGGGTISFEWPRHCSLWKEGAVQQFIDEFNLTFVKFYGCVVGLVNMDGKPLLKKCMIATDDPKIARA